MTPPTVSADPTSDHADRVRLHPCRLPTRVTWWASVDGRYLRSDYPTPHAARAAALAALTAPVSSSSQEFS